MWYLMPRSHWELFRELLLKHFWKHFPFTENVNKMFRVSENVLVSTNVSTKVPEKVKSGTGAYGAVPLGRNIYEHGNI